MPSQRDTQEGATSAQTAAASTPPVATETRTEAPPEPSPEVWGGDYYIGGILTIVSGLASIFMGVTALISASFYNNVPNFPFYYSTRSRGITLLVIGAVVLLLGVALLARVQWARIGAIVAVVCSALANFIFLPYYPFWSVIVIALNVVIIWQLARKGDNRQFVRLSARRMPR